MIILAIGLVVLAIDLAVMASVIVGSEYDDEMEKENRRREEREKWTEAKK